MCIIKFFYINKHNENIPVILSSHAKNRFMQRWESIYSQKLNFLSVEKLISNYFSKSKRISYLSREYKMRIKKYGSDSMFFFCNPFVFVVQGNVIKTIEIGVSNMRFLNMKNKLSSNSIKPTLMGFEKFKDARSNIISARISGKYFDESQQLKSTNLGRYDVQQSSISTHRVDKKLLSMAKSRFYEKYSGYVIDSLIVQFGKTGSDVLIIENIV